jgi:hypothetical protein
VLIAILEDAAVHDIHVVLVSASLYHLLRSLGFLRAERSCHRSYSSFAIPETTKGGGLDAILTIFSPAQMYTRQASCMCVLGGRGIVSQISSEGGTMFAGISSVLWAGDVSCNTHLTFRP